MPARRTSCAASMSVPVTAAQQRMQYATPAAMRATASASSTSDALLSAQPSACVATNAAPPLRSGTPDYNLVHTLASLLTTSSAVLTEILNDAFAESNYGVS